jgi:hypothetical protein
MTSLHSGLEAGLGHNRMSMATGTPNPPPNP